MRSNPDIFKAYDIRGIYPRELNEETAERIGYFATHFFIQKRKKKSPVILVMEDVRLSSRSLRDALVRGIIHAGGHVEDAGVGTTPLFYFGMQQKKHDGGIMVTASHNPAEYNGFKIRLYGGKPVSTGTGLERIRKRVLIGKTTPVVTLGDVKRRTGLLEEYVAFFKKQFPKDISLRVAIDVSGGAVAHVLPLILKEFPEIAYTPLFFEPDGSFKKHSPNPLLPESQGALIREMKKGGYQCGILFDGDGDRILFFDERGNLIRPDLIGGVMALGHEALSRSAFVFSANTSRVMRRAIEAAGGKVYMSRVGYVFMQAVMEKKKARLGAEMSGHFYFKEFGYDDSAVFAFLTLAEILSKKRSSLSSLAREFTKTPGSGEINYPVKDKKAILSLIKKTYRRGTISTIDGITVEFPEWWCNIRPSNTEPLVRVVIEAETEELLEEKKKEIEKLLRT